MSCRPRRCASGWPSSPWCRRLAGPGGGIALHDVIRDFLRAELGQQRLAALAGTCCWMRSRRTCPQRARLILPPGCAGAGGLVGAEAARTGTCGITSSSTCWMPGGPAMRTPSLVTCAGWGRGWSGSGLLPRLLIWPQSGHRGRPGCGRCSTARRTCWRPPSRPGRWWTSCTAGSPMTRTGDRRSLPCVTSATGRGWSTGGRCRIWLTPRCGAC